jgi:outer membrane protein OmpA-like peptidoglycan-associated protein
VAGVASEDLTKHGCPRDADGDGIVDGEDACPETAGVRSDDPSRHGCPPDADGDGIVDGEDACPDAAGEADEDPEKHGCPLVAIVVDEIRITEKVHFATRSARILPESNDLLMAIAKLLRDHPEVLLVSIEGHTDSRDNDYYNKQLSTWRAAAVRRFLIEKGMIEPSRLVSVGFGEEKPIADNATEEGMAKNRRVEFHIKKRAPRPSQEPEPPR